MNVTLLKRLIYDMAIVMKDHGLDKIDTHAALLIEMANTAVPEVIVNNTVSEDTDTHIEAIRNDNFHALGV